jgi:hypothetical protein
MHGPTSHLGGSIKTSGACPRSEERMLVWRLNGYKGEKVILRDQSDLFVVLKRDAPTSRAIL